jgi:hypothetical protein
MIEYPRMERLGQKPLSPERVKEVTDFFQKYKSEFYAHVELQDILNYAELQNEYFDTVMYVIKKNHHPVAE